MITIIETFLILSVIINITFLFYSRWLIKILLTRDEDIIAIKNRLEMYLAHVKSIHDLDIFYGDETLNSLLEHGKDLVKYMSDIDMIQEDSPPDSIDPGEQINV